MRRVIAPFSILAFVVAVALAAAAQTSPPPGTPSPAPAGAPSTPTPAASETPAEAATPTPPPYLFAPTPPPIIVEPPEVGVEPGKTASARINSVLGTVAVTVADPAVATAVVDQLNRVLFVSGVKLGTTTITLTDSRGVTRDVPVRVAYAAGSAADEIALRITGNPASAAFVRQAVAEAVERAATQRPGA